MVFILICVVLGAWIAILRSQQRIRQQQEQLGELTQRFWALERRVTQTLAPPPKEEPSQAAAQAAPAQATGVGSPPETMVRPTGALL